MRFIEIELLPTHYEPIPDEILLEHFLSYYDNQNAIVYQVKINIDAYKYIIFIENIYFDDEIDIDPAQSMIDIFNICSKRDNLNLEFNFYNNIHSIHTKNPLHFANIFEYVNVYFTEGIYEDCNYIFNYIKIQRLCSSVKSYNLEFNIKLKKNIN